MLGLDNNVRFSHHNLTKYFVNISRGAQILSLIMVLKHRPGPPSAEYREKIPYFIIAALGVNRTESLRSIAQKTGFNPDTVASYLGPLLKNGTVKKVPSGQVRYKLVEPDEKNLDKKEGGT